MLFREAILSDIKDLFLVRMSVTENKLVNTNLVTEDICIDYLTNRGKGWVYEFEGIIVGFGIVDLVDNSIWALFVKTGYERNGIGTKLLDIMLLWYFNQSKEPVWLSTEKGTKAEVFYRNYGWIETAHLKTKEIRFE